MSSLVSIVAASGPLHPGEQGPHVKVLQVALNVAGYRLDDDGAFGPGAERAVQRFQLQHGLVVDGVVGAATAAKLDLPHAVLVSTAAPQTKEAGGTTLPHDDTASLLAFYGKPWDNSALLVPIILPFRMTYREDNGVTRIVTKVEFHAKAAPALARVFGKVWDAYGHNLEALDATRFTKFSGTFNYRPIRGSSRLSCHAFGAAIDLDAEDLPLGRPNPPNGMPAKIVEIFKAEGFFWGGEYVGRKDPMHFQAAHE